MGAASYDFGVGHMHGLCGASLDLHTSRRPLVSSRYRWLEDELGCGVDRCGDNTRGGEYDQFARGAVVEAKKQLTTNDTKSTNEGSVALRAMDSCSRHALLDH